MESTLPMQQNHPVSEQGMWNIHDSALELLNEAIVSHSQTALPDDPFSIFPIISASNDSQQENKPSSSATTSISHKRAIDTTEEGEESYSLSKRPGRKPVEETVLESDLDPKQKRKAQNRAAQRAFRERKEKRVEELLDKIRELEASYQSKNGELAEENGALKQKLESLKQENEALKTSANFSVLPPTTHPVPSLLPMESANMYPTHPFLLGDVSGYAETTAATTKMPLYSNENEPREMMSHYSSTASSKGSTNRRSEGSTNSSMSLGSKEPYTLHSDLSDTPYSDTPYSDTPYSDTPYSDTPYRGDLQGDLHKNNKGSTHSPIVHTVYNDMANPIYTSIHHPIYNINGSSFYNETATPSSNDPHTADYSPLHTHTSGTPTHTSGSCTSGDDGMNSSGSCYSPHFSPDTKEEDIHSTTNELAPTLSKTHFDLIAPSLETDFLAMLEHDTVLSQLLYGKDNFFAHDTVSTTEDAWAAENSLHSLFSTDTDLFGLAAPPLPHTHYYLPLAEELISSERFQAMNSEDKKKYLCGRLQEANRRNVPILLEKRRLVEEAAFDIDLLCDDMLKKAKCSNQLSVLEERADGHIRLFTNF